MAVVYSTRDEARDSEKTQQAGERESQESAEDENCVKSRIFGILLLLTHILSSI